MGVVAHAAITDHQIGFVRHNRRNQRGDVLADILPIGVGVDDDISASRKRSINAALKGGGQPAVAAVADYVMDSEPAGDIGSAIVAAIVDHQHFDHVHPGQTPGQRDQRFRQAFRLVETRDLDDQLSHVAPLSVSSC